jgi:hypothetical protein
VAERLVQPGRKEAWRSAAAPIPNECATNALHPYLRNTPTVCPGYKQATANHKARRTQPLGNGATPAWGADSECDSGIFCREIQNVSLSLPPTRLSHLTSPFCHQCPLRTRGLDQNLTIPFIATSPSSSPSSSPSFTSDLPREIEEFDPRGRKSAYGGLGARNSGSSATGSERRCHRTLGHPPPWATVIHLTQYYIYITF